MVASHQIWPKRSIWRDVPGNRHLRLSSSHPQAGRALHRLPMTHASSTVNHSGILPPWTYPSPHAFRKGPQPPLPEMTHAIERRSSHRCHARREPMELKPPPTTRTTHMPPDQYLITFDPVLEVHSSTFCPRGHPGLSNTHGCFLIVRRFWQVVAIARSSSFLVRNCTVLEKIIIGK